MKYTIGPGMTANPLFLLGAVAGLIGVQFVSLGLMGEVLTRVYFESQGKRPYVVREGRNLGDDESHLSRRLKRPSDATNRGGENPHRPDSLLHFANSRASLISEGFAARAGHRAPTMAGDVLSRMNWNGTITAKCHSPRRCGRHRSRWHCCN